MPRFIYPTVGAISNWGAIINRNFEQTDAEFNKIYSNINMINELVGANVPYIDIREDYKFLDIECSKNGSDEDITYTFKYYKEVEDTDSQDSYEYRKVGDTSGWSADKGAPPAFLGSYVRNTTIVNTDGTSEKDTIELFDISFARGDFVVVTQIFDTITSTEPTAVVYKKFAPMGEYYIPALNTTNPYELVFNKTTYVDWLAQQNSLKYILPSIGYRDFNYFTVAKDENGAFSFSVNGTKIDYSLENETLVFSFLFSGTESNAANYRLNVDCALKEKNAVITNNPQVYYKYSIEAVADKEFQCTFTADIGGLNNNESLTFNISFEHWGQVISEVVTTADA